MSQNNTSPNTTSVQRSTHINKVDVGSCLMTLYVHIEVRGPHALVDRVVPAH